MRKLSGWGIVCLMLLCAFAVPAFAVCNASAQNEVDIGLGKLDGDTMNLSAAIVEFNNAIGFDASCAPAYVARAMVKVAQIYDTSAVQSLRNAYGDTRFFSSISKAGLTTDTVPQSNHNYTFVSATMNGSAIQNVLTNTVLPILDDALADLTTAEGKPDTAFNFRVPGRFISSDTRAEIDIADVYFFHGAILAAKAAIQIATAYNADVNTTFLPNGFKGFHGEGEHDEGEDTFLNHLQSSGAINFFTLKTGGLTNFSTAFSLLQQAESQILRFDSEVKMETDAQDTDLIAHVDTSGSLKLVIWDFINDSDINKFAKHHIDTVARAFAGKDLYESLDKENADLDSATLNVKSVFTTPPDRYLLPPINPARKLQWKVPFFAEAAPGMPTFGGALPGMTREKFFLLAEKTDSFIVVPATPSIQSYDLNALFPSRLPREIDFKFLSGTIPTVTITRKDVGAADSWTFKVQPVGAGGNKHLRIFFEPKEKFDMQERVGVKNFFATDSTLVYIVPWKVSPTTGDVVDAGSNPPDFAVNWQSAFVQGKWTLGAEDTLTLFQFEDPLFFAGHFNVVPNVSVSKQFTPTPASTFVDANVDHFGWFMIAETVPIVEVVEGFDEGDTRSRLGDSFAVRLKGTGGQVLSGKTVVFQVIKFPAGATSWDFDTPTMPDTLPDTNILSTFYATSDAGGNAHVLFTLGNLPGVYVVQASWEGGRALLFAFTRGYFPWGAAGAYNWEMVSLPLYLDTPIPAADTLLGKPAHFKPLTAAASTFIGDDFPGYTLMRWNPTTANSDPAFKNFFTESTLRMGYAYWLQTSKVGVLNAVRAGGGGLGYEVRDTVLVPLVGNATGLWNQVSTPYPFSILSKNIRVLVAGSSTPIGIDTAAAAPYNALVHKFYEYTGGGSNYSAGPTTTNPDFALFPFEGYWVKATASCTLVFPPQASAGADGGLPATAPRLVLSAPMAPKLFDNWSVQVMAFSKGSYDMMNMVGVRPTSSLASKEKTYAAPLAPQGVSLSIKKGPEVYDADYRAPGEKAEWEIEVYSPEGGEVMLRGANLDAAPADVPFTLRDQYTGAWTDLRQAGTYTYTSAPGETRKLTLYASSSLWDQTTKVILPQACVAQKLFGSHPDTLAGLRRLRDFLMRAPAGRGMVSMYYALTGN